MFGAPWSVMTTSLFRSGRAHCSWVLVTERSLEPLWLSRSHSRSMVPAITTWPPTRQLRVSVNSKVDVSGIDVAWSVPSTLAAAASVVATSPVASKLLWIMASDSSAASAAESVSPVVIGSSQAASAAAMARGSTARFFMMPPALG